MTVVSILDGKPVEKARDIRDVVVAFLETTGSVPTSDIAGRVGRNDRRAMLATLRRMEKEGLVESRRGSTNLGRTLLWFVPGKEHVSRNPTDEDDDPTPGGMAMQAGR